MRELEEEVIAMIGRVQERRIGLKKVRQHQIYLMERKVKYKKVLKEKIRLLKSVKTKNDI